MLDNLRKDSDDRGLQPQVGVHANESPLWHEFDLPSVFLELPGQDNVGGKADGDAGCTDEVRGSRWATAGVEKLR